MLLKDLKVGDKIRTTYGWGCLGRHVKRAVQEDSVGKFIQCFDRDVDGRPRRQKHYLDGQEDDSGNLVGLERA